MGYKLLSAVADKENIKCMVEYDIDGKSVETEVIIFMPADKNYVLSSLENRGISESTKITAIETNKTIAQELQALIK